MAHLYNDTYRKNKESQYTYENVCIVPGGRAGLSRVAAVIGNVYTVSRIEFGTTWEALVADGLCQSYQIPDYTAYDQVLSAFKRLVPVPTAWVSSQVFAHSFVLISNGKIIGWNLKYLYCAVFKGADY